VSYAKKEDDDDDLHLVCMGVAWARRQSAPPLLWRKSLAPGRLEKLRGSRLGLPFGPSLGMQMLQSFELP